jgi:hypothetical protein
MRPLLLLGLAIVFIVQTALHPKYDTIIRSEWKMAQDFMAMADDVGKKAYTVKPTCCIWEPHDGSFQGITSYYKGELNGLMYAKENKKGEWQVHIKWNTKLPITIRHEAAHYILWKLEHPCFAAMSLDGTHVGYHDFQLKVEYCEWWLNKYWGKEVD